jgi:hypothetical protein
MGARRLGVWRWHASVHSRGVKITDLRDEPSLHAALVKRVVSLCSRATVFCLFKTRCVIDGSVCAMRETAFLLSARRLQRHREHLSNARDSMQRGNKTIHCGAVRAGKYAQSAQGVSEDSFGSCRTRLNAGGRVCAHTSTPTPQRAGKRVVG